MAYFSRKNRFNRYFEGYEQRTQYDRNGNETTKFVYVGNYFQPVITEKAFIIRKVIYTVLLIAAIAMQFAAGIIDSIPMNHTKQMGVAQCLCILGFIAVAIFVISYVSSGHKMEQRSYKNAHDILIIMALVTWLVILASFICGIVTTFMVGGAFTFMYVLWLLAYLVSAACIFVIWYLEKNTSYTVLPPDHF